MLHRSALRGWNADAERPDTRAAASRTAASAKSRRGEEIGAEGPGYNKTPTDARMDSAIEYRGFDDGLCRNLHGAPAPFLRSSLINSNYGRPSDVRVSA